MNINDILQKQGFDPKKDKITTKSPQAMMDEINTLIRRMRTPEMIALKRIDEYNCMMKLEDDYPDVAPSLIRKAVRGFTKEDLDEIAKIMVRIERVQKNKSTLEKEDEEYKKVLDNIHVAPLVKKLEEEKKLGKTDA